MSLRPISLQRQPPLVTQILWHRLKLSIPKTNKQTHRKRKQHKDKQTNKQTRKQELDRLSLPRSSMAYEGVQEVAKREGLVIPF